MLTREARGTPPSRPPRLGRSFTAHTRAVSNQTTLRPATSSGPKSALQTTSSAFACACVSRPPIRAPANVPSPFRGSPSSVPVV